MSKKPRFVNPKFDDRAMILDPGLWPCWPYLPVKRRDYRLENKNLGLLVASETPWSVVYHVYLFDLPTTSEAFKALPQTTYADVDALLSDGWIVD